MKGKNSQLRKSSLGFMASLQFSSDGVMKSDKNHRLLE